MLSALGAALWAWGGLQLEEVKASPDKSWALPCYGCGEAQEQHKVFHTWCDLPGSPCASGLILFGRNKPSLPSLNAHPKPLGDC